MNWDWLIARHAAPKSAPTTDTAIEKPQAKAFATSVGVGFIDDRGVWYATQEEAERATATRYMESGVGACFHSATGFSPYHAFWVGEFTEFLAKPDTIRAMAILGQA